MPLLVVLYLICTGIGMPYYLMGAAWPSIYGELRVPDSWLGIISFILICCCIFGNAFSVKLIKHFKPGMIAAVCIFIMGLTLVGFGFSATFTHLCIFAAPLGLALGCIDAILNNFVAVNYKSRHMNWMHCCWGIGATTGPVLLSAGMERYGSWRAGYFSIGVVQFAIALVVLFTLSLWKKAAGSREIAPEHIKSDFREVMALKGIKLSLAMLFFYCALEITLGLWGSSYLVIVKNVSEEQAAGWISLLFLGMTVGRLIAGFLSYRFSNIQLMRIGSALIFTGIVVLFLSSSDIAYISGFFLFGLGCGPVWPCIVHETPKRFGESYSQFVVGLQLVSSNIGNAVAPLIFGAMTVYTGYAVLPLYLVVLLIIMVVTIELQNRYVPV